ncbi:MAG: hypothetical protein E6J62_19720 [Deltaproteobacteria bacterium]|nr:MAG: hypothetical protein E6J62_19720 [Deltaproteobacteria bacterium]
MATTRTVTSPAPFSRIVEARSTSSWKAALPAALIVIAAVIAAAYFAAKASEQSQLLAGARTEMQQNVQAVSQLQSRMATVDGDLARLRTAGRTTVILKPAASKAPRKGADTVASSWGAADGNVVEVAKLDPAQDGSAFAEGKDLPGVDKGKRILVSLDEEEAKKPGTEVFQADLPKLKPMASGQSVQTGAASSQGAAPAKADSAAPKQQ